MTIDEKEYQKRYRESHKEEMKIYSKQYYKTHKKQIMERVKQYNASHKDKRKGYCKKYSDTHREHIRNYQKKHLKSHRECSKKYYDSNRELCNERTKKCFDSNPLNRYRVYKTSAKYRNIVFNLSREEFSNIITQPCFYCGETSIPYGGIDRMNNEKNIGYAINNCVPCCKMCNKIKNKFSKDDFLGQIRKIHNHGTNDIGLKIGNANG